ncbi:MAG TPA: hypothetical protein PLH16_00635 [Candidatus Omnitrophota bacterium]|nr:hypothetical protein [Candidatus Omnitrophota bacterium]
MKLNVIIRVCALIGIVAVHFAATNSARSGTAPSNRKVQAITSPQSMISDQIAKFVGRKTGKELMEERSKQTAVPAKPASKGVSVPAARTSPKTVAASSRTAKPGYVPPAPPTKQPPQVSQIRQEVQRILDLNARIKSLQSNQAAQLQRVQEQARIHQKILDQIESSQVTKTASQSPSRDALIAQEKLRIIHDETVRGRSALEAAQTGGSSSTSANQTSMTVSADSGSSPLRS